MNQAKTLFLATLAIFCISGTQSLAKPYNVLYIAVDDLRTALGCYGDDIVKSPNIDRLAASGRLFTGAYTQQAVCGPSRAAIITGRLPDVTRVWHNRNKYRDTLPDVITLPQAFMLNGYTALSLGKIISGDPREEDDASWTTPAILKQDGWSNYYYPENREFKGKGPSHEMADVPDDGYSDGKLANLALDTLDDLHNAGKPFFLAVGFFKPHLPFNAPKKYWDLYDPDVFELKNEIKRVSGAPDPAYHSHRELGGYVDMPEDEQLNAEQTRILRHGYYACVSYVDTQIGKLLDKLEALGEADNTIVVLWGDHGFALGEASRWCKGTNFELDTRVPLIVKVPGMRQPGVATDALVELVDLYPTLAELAGVDTPWPLDGTSFRSILENPDSPGKEIVRSQFARPFNKADPEIMGYSIRTPTHRYGRWIDFQTREILSEELYDYTNPGSVEERDVYRIEHTNFINDPSQANVLESLRGKMDSRMALASVKGAKPFVHKQPLFTEGADGFVLYRIPGIVVTACGTAVAYCEARKFTNADRGEIEIHMRRSTDGGMTWSPARQIAHMGARQPRNPHLPKGKMKKNMGGPDEQTVNNAVAIATADGLVHMIYCVEYQQAFHMVSRDDGISWSKPVEITSSLDGFRSQIDWTVIASGPGHAIEMDSGRLVVPFWMTTYAEEAPLRKAVGVIYSDDKGANWQTGNIAIPLGGEPNIAQLADGRVFITSRNTHPSNRRLVAWSSDGVNNWTEPQLIEDLPEPGCMAGLVTFPGKLLEKEDFLLYSGLDTTKRPHKDRVNVTIRASFDGGLKWPVSKRLEDGPSAYSDLAVLPDGTILCFYESGGVDPPKQYERQWAYSYLNLARFNLAWIDAGTAHFKAAND